MRIFVTGGAGYIGSVTSRLLLDSGHQVSIFDNLERGHREALDPRAAFIEGDLRDKAATGQALTKARADAVIHFAAYALVGESMQRPEFYFGNNVCGCVNLIEAMLEAGVPRIVFSSSCATYGQPDSVPIREDTPQRPTNPYGESKLMCEHILEWHSRLRGLKAVSLRYFNAAGATELHGEDHAPETHLVPNVLAVALGVAPEVRVFGDDYDTPDGTCVRDYIHVLDLARAHALALGLDRSDAFNLGTGQGCSVMQVIETARRVTGRPIPVRIEPRRPGDPARLVACADKARADLGWQPEHSGIEEIVESAWRWHLAHPRGYAG